MAIRTCIFLTVPSAYYSRSRLSVIGQSARSQSSPTDLAFELISPRLFSGLRSSTCNIQRQQQIRRLVKSSPRNRFGRSPSQTLRVTELRHDRIIITRAPAAFITGFPLTCVALPARAEMGPCKPLEKRDILICGSGNGAAIVIRDTPSPSGRLALAWRTPAAPPTEQPDWDKIELLVLRLADGVVSARQDRILGHGRRAREPVRGVRLSGRPTAGRCCARTIPATRPTSSSSMPSAPTTRSPARRSPPDPRCRRARAAEGAGEERRRL